MPGPADVQNVPIASVVERPVIFLHIPKTAGTSFIGTLRNTFGQHRIVRLVTIGTDTGQEIGRLVTERPGGLACVIGHFPYHMIARQRERCAIFTILRHPLARVMSLYRFLQAQPEAEQRRLGLDPGFGFETFITSRHPELFVQINDGMCRQLCGDPRLNSPESPHFWRTEPSPEVLGRALANLEGFDFGLAERMDATMRMARMAWGIPYDLTIGRDNVTSRGAAEPGLERLLAIIARNQMDLVLYERAAALFASRLAWLDGAEPVLDGRTVFRPVPGQSVPLGRMPGLQGFHEAEESGLAWLDHARPARIHFDLPGASARIRLNCYAIPGNYPLQEISLDLNGLRLPIKVTPGKEQWFTLETPQAPIRHPLNVLGIHPPYFIPVRYLDPGSADPRSLAIALSNIAIDT